MELIEQLDGIFYPGSIAVIGASRKKGKIGNQVLRNLVYGGATSAPYTRLIPRPRRSSG